MKHVIPFKIPHNVRKKEDYFQIGVDVAGGEFVDVSKLNTLQIIKQIWRQYVHAHGRGFPFPEICCFFAKKSVYTPYNNFLGSRWWTRLIRRFILNKYNIIIAQTDYARRNYIKEGARPDKIRYLPIPIDYEYFSNPKGGKEFREKYGLGKEPFGLCVGFRSSKNPEIIAEACKKAGIKVVFIGHKERKDVNKGFEWLLPSQKILDMEGDNVILTGPLWGDDMLAALDAATIYLNSDEDGGQCFSLIVYEAAASGRPLCLPNFGVFEIFQDCALFHNNHNANQLAKNIERYLDSSELRKRNGRGAQKISKQFDYHIVRKEFEKFYNEFFDKSQ